VSEQSLYDLLGGYNGVAAFVNDLFPRVKADPEIGRFWRYRGDDGLEREKQLTIDYLCSCSGGQMHYRGREMKLTHQGMGVTENDWATFMRLTGECMLSMDIPKELRNAVTDFMESLKAEIILP